MDDGQPVMGWKKDTPREIQESADSYQRYLEKWATDLVQRPQEVLPKIIEQEFDKLFEQRIRARDEERELATFAERVRETNRDWMYTTDSQGREVFTQEGQLMKSFRHKEASDSFKKILPLALVRLTTRNERESWTLCRGGNHRLTTSSPT